MEDTIYVQKPATKQLIIKETDLIPGQYYIGQVRDTLYAIGWWDGHTFVINNLEWGQWLTSTITYNNFTPQTRLTLKEN